MSEEVVTTCAQFREKYDDFRLFVEAVWKHLNLPVPSEIQLDIANTLALGPKRFILEAFRGVGKSWLTVAFTIWLLGWFPEYNILVVSASKPQADEFSTFCLRLIREMDDLAWLTPTDGQRDSKISFDVRPAPAAKAPSVKSLGITSQLTGSRADIIIADDPEIPSNSLTPAMREKLSEQVKEFDAILKPEAHCRVIFLGTPQTEDSIYNKLQRRGYTCRIWPSRYPNAEEREEYGQRLAPSIARRSSVDADQLAGTPTDPRRFTDLDLRERLLSYGLAGYALQFQLRTRLSDLERFPLKAHDFIVMDIDLENAPEKPIWGNSPELLMKEIENNLAMDGDYFYRPMNLVGKWLPYSGIVMTVDPAGRGKDETGYCVLAMLNGFLYILDCAGLQGGYDEHVLRKLSEIAKKFKVKHILVEDNFGDGMFSALWKPVLAKSWDVTIEGIKHSVQKERRICDALEPVLQGHRLVISPDLIEQDFRSLLGYPTESGREYSLVYQMTRLTRDKGALVHDDRLDALSMAAMYYVEQMAADADTEQNAHRAMLLDKELERFIDTVYGTKDNTRTPIWTETMR
jgi:Autographiviridae terminase large subunit